ncbi:MAG TPA: EAL domain-containing protein [Allosphingosinicella sp.]
MRKGRFAGLHDRSSDAVAPLATADLLLFDFRAPADEDGLRVATERARQLPLALPLLAGAHFVWGGILLALMIRAGASGIALAAFAIAASLLLDFALWKALASDGRAPHQAMRLTAGYALATAALWGIAAAAAMSGTAGESTLAKAALVAGIGTAIPAFFFVPALMIAAAGSTFGLVTLLRSEEPLAAICAASSLFLLALSIARARALILSAQQRLALEWEAKKVARFVGDFEASGRGWFWETNAEGLLTYLSAPLAMRLGEQPAALVGRRIEEVLLSSDTAEAGQRPLGFHLSARFPFADVVVRAPGAEEIWWSLSGNPNFDEFGRFLGFRGIGTNLTEERRSEAEKTRLARYDSLTGLPNRAMMRDMLDQALANADARRRGCALMLIDLDRFKQVNDTLGHPMGDKLLKKVARRLEKVLGQDGAAGRLGGDEFEAILPGIEEESALADLAARLIAEVSRPYRIEGHDIVIGASVGIAVARPGKAWATGLIKEADLALYAAKGAGRGTFRLFEAEMHAEAADRQILEADLRDALGRDQLRLLYQPIVDTLTEEVVAFEALLRWHHPTRGILAPLDLIPVAEEIGLMPRIGAWVLRTACAEAATWNRHIRVAVNLCASELADPALAATVTSALAGSGLEPERLEIEIGEGTVLADGGAEVLARLKAIGVRLALDNFGTGSVGLGQLREAPLDKIKVDRSFVRAATGSASRNAAIVRAIAVLAESLGMDTTAEGAETLEELALIRRLGCSQVQGFLFGKPMAAEDALALATASKPSAEVAGFTRPPRHRIIRMGNLLAEGGAIPVRLRNISARGAMIECERNVAPDTLVVLDLSEAGAFEAEVRWSQRGQIGLEFAREFNLARLSKPRPGTGGKMLTPNYLDPAFEAAQQAPAAPSPLAKKPARRGL